MKIVKARIDKSYANEIKRIVTNYNAKISRLAKSGAKVTLPEKTSVKEVKKLLERKQINKRLKELQMFSQRGMETKTKQGVTRYQIKIARSRIRRAKLSLTKRIAKVENKFYEKYADENERVINMLIDDELTNLKAKREILEELNIKELSGSRINDKIRMLGNVLNYNQIRTAKMRDDYISKLKWISDIWGGNDKDIKKIKSSLMFLDDEQFAKLMKDSDEVRSIFEKIPSPDRMGTFDTEDFSPLVNDIIHSLSESIDDLIKNYIDNE